jgi:multiple sugar transport system substrate-binding protein
MVSQAKKVGEAEGIDGLLFQAADYEGLTCVFLELYACHGEPMRAQGERAVLDPDATRRTLQFMHDALHLHGITPDAVLSQMEIEQTEAFAAGEALFMRNWRGAYPYLRQRLSADQIGVMTMPSSRGPISGGFLLAVNRRTEVPDLALALADFLTRPESQRRLALRGQSPALAALYGEGVGNVPHVRGVPAVVPRRAVIRPQSPYYFELSQIITEEVRAVLREKQNVERGTARLVSRSRKLRLLRRAAPGFPKTNYMTRFRP